MQQQQQQKPNRIPNNDNNSNKNRHNIEENRTMANQIELPDLYLHQLF